MTDRRRGVRLSLISMLLACGGALLYLPVPVAERSTEQWLPVVAEPLVQRIGLVGQIEPGTLLTLAAPFEGQVQERRVEPGQQVGRDQLLLSLDTEQLNIQLRDALAERLKAQSAVQQLDGWADGQEMARARRALRNSQLNLTDSERKLKETRTLVERGIVPRMELDALVQQTATQRMDVKAAEAELAEVRRKGEGDHLHIARMQLSNAITRHAALQAQEQQRDIRAPFAGIVMRLPNNANGEDKPIQRGSRVTQGQSLFGLANLERLKVVAKVDEADINELQAGQVVDISGDGFEGIQLKGRITRVGAQAVQRDHGGNGAAYEVEVDLPALDADPQRLIRLGMSARLSIITYQNPLAVVLPAEAIREQDGQFVVMVRESAEQPARPVAVTLGRSTSMGVEVFGVTAGWVSKGVAEQKE